MYQFIPQAPESLETKRLSCFHCAFLVNQVVYTDDSFNVTFESGLARPLDSSDDISVSHMAWFLIPFTAKFNLGIKGFYLMV